MTVKYTQEQAAAIRDHMNNARQDLVCAGVSMHHNLGAVEKCIEGARTRLDKLAEIIDNGEVEETQ